ncbi:MAG: hypothetical protein V3U75_12790 [Methylococcaceae bacterium]
MAKNDEPKVMGLSEGCNTTCRENAHTFLQRKIQKHKEMLKQFQALEADINWDNISPETDEILFNGICNCY